MLHLRVAYEVGWKFYQNVCNWHINHCILLFGSNELYIDRQVHHS